jgi:hypothetical protein
MKGWLDKYNDGGPIQPNYNDYSVSAGPDFQGDGYSNVGRNYSPAWGGQFAMGGSMPGATGHMYAREGAPRNFGGKMTVPSAQDGETLDIASAIKNIPQELIDESSSPYRVNILKNAVRNDIVTKYGKPLADVDEAMVNEKTQKLLANKKAKMLGTKVNLNTKPDPTALAFYNHNDQSISFTSAVNNMPVNEIKQIARHEYNHAFDDGGRYLTNYEKEAIEKSTKDAIDNNSVMSNKFMYINNLSNPTEVNARLRELRADLKDQGIYDGSKEDAKLEHLDKIRGSSAYGDLLYLMHDKEIVNLLNTIAANNHQQGMPMAQNGMEMKYYQEGLDFQPKSISKNGSVIKDDMGQWNHPGEITEIGSNQITMQGVPYPVLGISDTGDTQMMYPDQEYQYDGDSVTEYPIMQNGGWLDSLVDMGKGVVDYVGGLFDDTTPAPVVQKAAPVKSKLDSYDTMIQLGYNSPQGQKLEKQLGVGSTEASEYKADKNRIKLNTGRFAGANVSSRLIDDLAEAAKRSGIPIGQLLTLAGRESTFGEDKLGHRGHLAKNDFTSGWNVAEDYTPYDPHRFLADKKVPGINVVKTNHGYNYEVTNVKAINEYLKKNPQIFEQYRQKIEATPDIGNKNYFDLSAEFLKKKGIKGYNPGDPTYEKMFKQDYATLKKDKALMEYLKKKGYKYEQGGQLKKLDQLTNFTNYNPTQPSGWLEKYQ